MIEPAPGLNNFPAQLRLLIRDDGSGFRANGPQVFQLQGMRERVQALGGAFSIESAPERGTCLHFHSSRRGFHRRRRAPGCDAMTSVLIVDDHPIVLQGCRRVLEDAGVGPIFEAKDMVNGYRLYHRHRPDVVIVDLSIAGDGLGGLSLIRRIRTNDARARILVLSMYSDPMIVARTLEAGASGYVLKDTSSDELVKAVEHAVAGKPFISGDLAVRVAMLKTSAHNDPLSELTPRELQTLSPRRRQIHMV